MGTPPPADEPVADYLARLDEASNALPRNQREDVRNDVREYIATQRAAGAGNILDRLGEPAELVDAARRDRQRFTVPAYVGERLTGGSGWARPPARGRPSTAALILISALVLIGLCVGLGLLFFSPSDVRYR
jgi:hypothetical protein